MHYVGKRGGPSLGYQVDDTPIEKYVRDEVVPRIPADSWQETDEPLPLQYHTDVWTIATVALPHCTGGRKTDAVYVLECIHNTQYQHTALSELGKYKKKWQKKIPSANRLLYVGVTKNLVRRLDQHLNNTDDRGAHFNRVFPPVRLLDVSWYSSYTQAHRAEELTAKLLRERFPGDYVSQPG